ncbi:MAG TPA: phosphoribosylanthranilate isomerase [Gammaproteobacteria bacterium]|nr:phosphoribosylanthranilate isomerase [Gammaproteobacteria bacterium]
MFVKICGLTDETAVAAAIEAGADALGFVFAESPREVSPQRAHELCRQVPETTIRVAVMHHPSPERFDEVIATFAPDWVQTDAEDFASLPASGPAKLLPVFRDGATRDLTRFPPRLLFEGVASGSGTTADWDEARRIAGRAELILAGGLDAANVEGAMSRIRPFGVDVSSGVEAGRGRKDPAKIREFVARVRAWERQQ